MQEALACRDGQHVRESERKKLRDLEHRQDGKQVRESGICYTRTSSHSDWVGNSIVQSSPSDHEHEPLRAFAPSSSGVLRHSSSDSFGDLKTIRISYTCVFADAMCICT